MGKRGGVAGAVIALTVITVISKLMGFSRELILARSFGVSALTDALVSAQFIPSLVDMVVNSALVTTLVPLLTSTLAEGEEQFERFVTSVTTFFTGLYLAGTIILFWGAPLVMNLMVPGLQDDAAEQAVQLVRIVSPCVFLFGTSAILTAMLTFRGRFLLPAIAGLGLNVAVIVAALLTHGHVSVTVITWASVIGGTVQLLLLFAGQSAATRRAPWSARLDRHYVWTTIKTVGPLVAAGTVMQVTLVADKFLASHMASGSISALGYAMKLVQLPVGILVTGLTTVLHTRFSRLSVNGGNEVLQQEVRKTVRGLLFIMLPVTALFIVLAEPGVQVAFQRGTFDSQAVNLTSGAVRWYATALIPMAALPLLTNLALSLRNSRVQLLASLASTSLYILSAFALRTSMEHQGLALAFALGQWVALCITLAVVSRLLGGVPLWHMSRGTATAFGATGLLASAAWLSVKFLSASPVLKLTVGGSIGVICYVAAHLLLGSDELKWGVEFMNSTLHRMKIERSLRG